MSTGAWIAFVVISVIFLTATVFCFITDMYKGGKYRSIWIDKIGRTIIVR